MLVVLVDQVVELELSGMGLDAWRLSPAQVFARHAKLQRMRDAEDLRRFGAAFAANPQDKKSAQHAQKWLDARQ